MSDVADKSTKHEELMLDVAIQNARNANGIMGNIQCPECKKRNDQPEYRICSGCAEDYKDERI